VDEPLDASELKPPIVTDLKGRDTILVVEDDKTLREVICKGLKKFGYGVLEAANGGEALLICEKRKGPIDLILTDVVLPQMSGRELVERLEAMRPGIKVLYMSGYTENAIVNNGILKENVGFLQKPFKVNILVLKIREIMSACQSAASNQ
jgi:CheY-like chemotaxis protein